MQLFLECGSLCEELAAQEVFMCCQEATGVRPEKNTGAETSTGPNTAKMKSVQRWQVRDTVQVVESVGFKLNASCRDTQQYSDEEDTLRWMQT